MGIEIFCLARVWLLKPPQALPARLPTVVDVHPWQRRPLLLTYGTAEQAHSRLAALLRPHAFALWVMSFPGSADHCV